MKDSIAMTELRKIKEELSSEYLNTTPEEWDTRSNEDVERLRKEFGLKFVYASPPKRAPANYITLQKELFENITIEQVCEAVAEYKIKHNILPTGA